MDELIHDMSALLAYQDDVMIFSAKKEEPDSKLELVLGRLMQKDVST